MDGGKRSLKVSDKMHRDTVTIVGKRYIIYRVVPPKRIIKKTQADRCFRHTLWVRDQDVSRCMMCSAAFGLLRWKHHCRLCGNLICHDCSSTVTVVATLPEDALYNAKGGPSDADVSHDSSGYGLGNSTDGANDAKTSASTNSPQFDNNSDRSDVASETSTHAFYGSPAPKGSSSQNIFDSTPDSDTHLTPNKQEEVGRTHSLNVSLVSPKSIDVTPTSSPMRGKSTDHGSDTKRKSSRGSLVPSAAIRLDRVRIGPSGLVDARRSVRRDVKSSSDAILDGAPRVVGEVRTCLQCGFGQEVCPPQDCDISSPLFDDDSDALSTSSDSTSGTDDAGTDHNATGRRLSNSSFRGGSLSMAHAKANALDRALLFRVDLHHSLMRIEHTIVLRISCSWTDLTHELRLHMDLPIESIKGLIILDADGDVISELIVTAKELWKHVTKFKTMHGMKIVVLLNETEDSIVSKYFSSTPSAVDKLEANGAEVYNIRSNDLIKL